MVGRRSAWQAGNKRGGSQGFGSALEAGSHGRGVRGSHRGDGRHQNAYVRVKIDEVDCVGVASRRGYKRPCNSCM
jgi:hypothetical protein